MKTNTQIITPLYKHVLKLSNNNPNLAKERISIIISMTNGNRRLINRLNNESTNTWIELQELTKKLLQFKTSRMKTTEQILEAIREANPELKELSFGCKIEFSQVEFTYIGLNYAGNHICYTTFGSQTATFSDKNREWKYKNIIGHEPTLEHLLLATDNQYLISFKDNTIALASWEETFATDYDLTKSVRENLDTNKDLRELLTKLL